MKNLDRLITLFDAAEQSRRIVDPDRNGILCPICWNEFLRESLTAELLSVDHIPQQSWGDLWEIITCTTCNVHFGSKFQGKVSGLKDIENLGAGISGKKHKAKVVTNIGEYNAEIFNDENKKLVMKGAKKINNPIVSKFWQELGAEQNITLSSIRILLKQPFEPEAVPVVLLRDSYLLAFHYLGYPYLCRADLQDLRTILYEHKPIPEGAILTLPSNPMFDNAKNGSFFWVQAPEKLAGFLVKWIIPKLGARFIVLPFFPIQWSTFKELCAFWAQESKKQTKIEIIIAPVVFSPSARFSFKLIPSVEANATILLSGE